MFLLWLSAAEILQANDSLTHVINLYKQQVKGEIVNGTNAVNAQKQTGRCTNMFLQDTRLEASSSSFFFFLTLLNWPVSIWFMGTALLDLSGLDTSPQSPPSFPEFPTPTDHAASHEMGISLLDDELMSLGKRVLEHFIKAVLCLFKPLSIESCLSLWPWQV